MSALFNPETTESPADNPAARMRTAVERALSDSERTKQISSQREIIKSVVSSIKRPQRKLKSGYVKTGIVGLDELLVDGIPKGASVLVAGNAGAGKTILALQLAYESARAGEKVLYLTFEESEQKLIRQMNTFGWQTDDLIDNGFLQIKRVLPADVKRSVDAIAAKSRGELLIDVPPLFLPANFNADKLIVDSLTAIASTFVDTEEVFKTYIEQLFMFLERLPSTNLLITETAMIPVKAYSPTKTEELLADGIIVLYNMKKGNIRESAIEVLDMHGSEHKKRIVAMKITGHGIDVYPDQEVFWEVN